MNQILADYWPACIIAASLAGFTIDFIARFLLPAFRLRHSLQQSVDTLQQIREGGPVTDLDDLAAQAMMTDRLRILWQEYAKTLHPQRAPDAFGQNRVVRWRAAALAETFFTEQAVIESPLATGYFGHLPGILTGMGIIGTFSGLIRGLLHFGVSTDSHAVEQSLRSLMKAVGQAFVLSSAAIVLAITLTWLEKMMVSSLSGQLADLRQAIDVLFATGADAEYLDRIMKASETSATQAVQLKDALVSDLRQILIDLTARQMAAAEQQGLRISAELGNALQGTLTPIAQAVHIVGQAQGDAVHRLLADVLADFSAQIRDTFGVQMEAMQRSLEGANQAMQSTGAKLDQLASRQQEQAGGVMDSLSAQVVQLLASSAKTNEAMRGSVLSLSTSTADSITSMREGARALGDAADELARVATRAADALRLASGTSEAMREAADSLVSASVTTRQVSADYERTRDVFAGMIAEFHTEQSRREANTSNGALTGLQDGADRARIFRLPPQPVAKETELQSSL